MSVSALAIFALGMGGTYSWMIEQGFSPPQTSAPPPGFIKIDPVMVNLPSDDDDDHALNIGLVLRTPDAKDNEAILPYVPQMRSRLLVLLSAQHVADLLSPDGKTRLLNTLLHEAQSSGPAGQSLQVDKVLLSDFVVR